MPIKKENHSFSILLICANLRNLRTFIHRFHGLLRFKKIAPLMPIKKENHSFSILLICANLRNLRTFIHRFHGLLRFKK
ncbi:uncharacterized protein Dvar_31110 [Desulfosarcina variabilis str. Montpellier]